MPDETPPIPRNFWSGAITVTFAVTLAVLLHPPGFPESWASVAPVGLLSSSGLLPPVLLIMPVLTVALVAGLGYALIAPRPRA